jgi:O-acetyl-ADP-ribose deacetylase (regulator of RNase III)
VCERGQPHTQGTGYYGFPMAAAANIALGAVRRWLDEPEQLDSVERVVFCVYTDLEMTAYTALWSHYFP